MALYFNCTVPNWSHILGHMPQIFQHFWVLNPKALINKCQLVLLEAGVLTFFSSFTSPEKLESVALVGPNCERDRL